MSQYSILLALPFYGQSFMEATSNALINAKFKFSNIDNQINAKVYATAKSGISPISHNFDQLLIEGLNLRDEGKVSHLIICHADVEPMTYYPADLVEVMEDTGSVVVGTIIPIKENDNNRTSTAIGDSNDPWKINRYITMSDYPEDSEYNYQKEILSSEFKFNGEILLINTGLCLIDLGLTDSRISRFWDSFSFRHVTRITRDSDGKRIAQSRSEDWEMSRDLSEAGLPYCATWKPEVNHWGYQRWPNHP